jgi:predicted nucleic acid-binding protein
VTPCFADTFFFLALLNARDRTYHEKARAANRVDRAVVTSQWVLIELADHLCDLNNRRLFGQVYNALVQDHRYTIIPVDAEAFDEAVKLYQSRRDKAWSLTDCTSFVIMRLRHLRDALTADHHFEQAGFNALLK